MPESVVFSSEDTTYEISDQDNIRYWLTLISRKYGKEIRHLEVIVCSDEYLRKVNREQLNHDYYTDVITLQYHDEKSDGIVGDIFVSIDRVNENASEFDSNVIDELHRVIVHGLLHLLGYRDNSEEAKKEMKEAENLSLNLRMF